VDHEDDVVIPIRRALMSSDEIRPLVRSVCRTPRRWGWEILVDQLERGAPSFPIIDELIKLCVSKIKAQLLLDADQVIRGSLTIKCESMKVDQMMIDSICRQLEKILQGRDHQFHLSLLSMRKDQEIVTLVSALVRLHELIGRNEATIMIA